MPLEEGQFQGFLFSSIREASFTRYYFYKYLKIQVPNHCNEESCLLRATLAMRDSENKQQNGGRIIKNQDAVIQAFESFVFIIVLMLFSSLLFVLKSSTLSVILQENKFVLLWKLIYIMEFMEVI